MELLDHLASKRGEGSLEPHVYIDEFIPSLEGDEGICYTHPENLPGELSSYKLLINLVKEILCQIVLYDAMLNII